MHGEDTKMVAAVKSGWLTKSARRGGDRRWGGDGGGEECDVGWGWTAVRVVGGSQIGPANCRRNEDEGTCKVGL